MPKIQEHAKNMPEVKERRRTFFLDTAQNHGNIEIFYNAMRVWMGLTDS